MTEQRHLAPIQPSQLVEVEGKTYQIIQVQPQSISPHYQQPQYIQPYQPQRSSLWDDPKTVILMGVGCAVLGGFGAWVLLKPAPAPVQTGPTIVMPPQPEKKPYTREECRPAGLFGWGSECYRERGYQ